MPNNRLCLLLYGLLIGGTAVGQQSAHTTGGTAIGFGGSATFSIGQPFFDLYSGASGSAAAGVQHPYEILVVAVHENVAANPINAFPNPTSDELFIQLSSLGFGESVGVLYDSYGKKLFSQLLSLPFNSMNPSNLPIGHYLLQVQSGGLITTSKITKQY